MEPGSGKAMRLTTAPVGNSAVQDRPQSMPAGLLMTLPTPTPPLLTASPYCETAEGMGGNGSVVAVGSGVSAAGVGDGVGVSAIGKDGVAVTTAAACGVGVAGGRAAVTPRGVAVGVPAVAFAR
jgi:hypothetical protein